MSSKHPHVQLPDFFLPASQLEEKMRSLRLAAISRQVPRTFAGQEAQCSGKAQVPVLSRPKRTVLPAVMDSDSTRTNRIAEIFMSNGKT